MKLPAGTIQGELLKQTFENSIEYHINILLTTIGQFEPTDLFRNWRILVRSIDELINIPMELNDEGDIDAFMAMSYDFSKPSNKIKFNEVQKILANQFDDGVAQRFKQITLMALATHKTYLRQGIYLLQGSGLNFSSNLNSIGYFGSRRIYYLTLLFLIPRFAKGTATVPYLMLMSNMQYTLDSCMVGVATAYYTLLANECLPDYEMESDGTKATGNFDFTHLEGFFMDPQTLTLLDQMELRPGTVEHGKMLGKSDKKLFSFSEVANTMTLFEGAYQKYDVKESPQFKELNGFLRDIAVYLHDDFDLEIEQTAFSDIKERYKTLSLEDEASGYFEALNSLSPFQKLNGYYYSTVVLLTRFVYRTLSRALLKNKTYQIHAGFVFEDRVGRDLTEYGFKLTDVTRINHKEFDLITMRGNKLYNFQCKNNFFDISSVNYNYKKIARLNRQLSRYYEKALEKEKDREQLIFTKFGIPDIQHFVISRYPIITRNQLIINYRDLKKWLQDLSNEAVAPY